jgi:5'(3')-deoxyribonucleotidase
MTRPRVLLDVDGVLADFVGHTLTLLGDMAPAGGRDAFTSWDMLSAMSPRARAETEARWRRPGWCLTMPVCTGAQNAVDRIGLRADVVYVTAPMHGAPHWMYERSLWLERQFAADPRAIVFAHDKSLVSGNVFVDDRAENVDEWAAAHPDSTALLWDAPYNRHWVPAGRNSMRVAAWADVIGAVARCR